MSALYIDRKDTRIKVDGGALALYTNGVKRASIPLKGIERVVLRARVDLDTRVLGALAERGIGLVTFSPRRGERTATMLGRPHNDARRRLAQYRAYLHDDLRRQWAWMLVRGKLEGQRRGLDRARQQRPDLRKPLTDGIARLHSALATLNVAPAEAPALERLRGIEGAAAAGYFEAFTALFPPALAFQGRNRRPPRDPVNACLSLGYTLMHFDAVQACHAAGLDPLLGLYHEPAFGRESLATDLIEPLRPHVDAWVWALFRERTLAASHFSQDQIACLLGKAGRQHFYRSYETFAKGTRRLLRWQTAKIAKDLIQGEPMLLSQHQDNNIETALY